MMSEGFDRDLVVLVADKNIEFAVKGLHKPDRPKEAMESAMRVVRRPRSSSVFYELASQVGVTRCTDATFARFKEILRNWFPQ